MSGPKIKGARSYLDTITLFGRQPLPRPMLQKLRRLQGKAFIHERHPVISRGGLQVACNYLVSIHQPKIAALSYLASQQATGTYSIHAVHIAFDFLTSCKQEALDAGHYFHQRLIHTWRRPQQWGSVRGTYYSKRYSKAARNIAIYCDRPSKIGGDPCCHLELRFTGAGACRRAGITSLAQLIQSIEAATLLRHETKLMVVEPNRLDRSIQRITREYFPKTKLRHPLLWVSGAKEPITIARLEGRIRQLLIRGLSSGDASGPVRSSDVWDSPNRRLRSALVEVPWDAAVPDPTWHCWR